MTATGACSRRLGAMPTGADLPTLGRLVAGVPGNETEPNPAILLGLAPPGHLSESSDAVELTLKASAMPAGHQPHGRHRTSSIVSVPSCRRTSALRSETGTLRDAVEDGRRRAQSRRTAFRPSRGSQATSLHHDRPDHLRDPDIGALGERLRGVLGSATTDRQRRNGRRDSKRRQVACGLNHAGSHGTCNGTAPNGMVFGVALAGRRNVSPYGDRTETG